MISYTPTPDFYNDYISHHGVKGQKWGVKNGPPYPLQGGGGSKSSAGSNKGSVQKKQGTSKQKVSTTKKEYDWGTGQYTKASSNGTSSGRKAIDDKLNKDFENLKKRIRRRS